MTRNDMIPRVLLLACGLWIGACGAEAQETLVLKDGFEKASLGAHLAILRDPSRALTLQDVMAPDRAERFIPNRADAPSFGYKNDAFWVRFTVRSESAGPLDVVAELATSRFDWLEWHVVSEGRSIATELSGNLRSALPSSNRALLPALALTLGPGREVTVYLRVETETAVLFPLVLYSAPAYMTHVMKENAWNYGHMGLSLALALISVVMGLVLSSRMFAFHAGLVVFYLAHIWIYSGYYVWMQWPAAGYMARQGMLGIGGLALVCLLAHVREFFGAEMLTSRIYRVVWIVMWVMLACSLAMLVLPYRIGVQVLNGIWVVVNGLSAGTSIWQYAIRKRNYWRFNLLAWAISAAMLSLVMGELSGILPLWLNPEAVLRNLLLVIAILLLVAMFDRLQLLARRDLDAREADRNLAESRFQTLRYQLGAVGTDAGPLAPGASFDLYATNLSVTAPVVNIGTVIATPALADGTPLAALEDVTDSDDAYAFTNITTGVAYSVRFMVPKTNDTIYFAPSLTYVVADGTNRETIGNDAVLHSIYDYKVYAFGEVGPTQVVFGAVQFVDAGLGSFDPTHPLSTAIELRLYETAGGLFVELCTVDEVAAGQPIEVFVTYADGTSVKIGEVLSLGGSQRYLIAVERDWLKGQQAFTLMVVDESGAVHLRPGVTLREFKAGLGRLNKQGMTLTWASLPGSTYDVYRCTKMGGAWKKVAVNVVADGSTCSVIVPTAGVKLSFFKIVMRNP